MKEKEFLITELLTELGLCCNYKGYDYLFYALLLLVEQEELLSCITKGVYSQIADYYQVKPASVERNIRTAIQVIWEKNKESSIFKGYCCCPSNGHFMDLILHVIEKRSFSNIC